MFKNFRNNYYFGKAGQADLTPDDLPTTRWQLFTVTLRTRLGSMIRLNIGYALIWIPTIVVLFLCFSGMVNLLQNVDLGDGTSLAMRAAEAGDTAAAAAFIPVDKGAGMLDSLIFTTLVWLLPCIAITGPVTAGISKIMRNWARDEHAFVWSDFKDAVKENWKQGLVVSVITGILPLAVYVCYNYYSNLSLTNGLMIVPQALVLIVGAMWAVSVTYMYPLMVCYELKLKGLFRNAFLLGIARLPQSVGVRLLLCVPAALAVGIYMLFPSTLIYVVMVIFLYYALIGLSLSRFISAAYCNAVFDRFINSRIEGVPVNRGMAAPDTDDAEETADSGDGAEE